MQYADDALYPVWYQTALGPAHSKLPAVLRTYGTVKGFYQAGPQSWKSFGAFTPRELGLLKSTPLEKACRILDACERLGFGVLTPDMPGYPKRLIRIADPPAALYVKGELPEVDENVLVGVVGTRSATSYGHQAAFRLSYQMAKAGAVIVSGGAVGIDSDAHGGALQGGGKTVAVLGCGIDYPYLMKNESLRQLIAQNGALVSEFPPGTAPSRFTFPIRNRIISALSLGVVIIEAGLKSGSLITAGHALEQGKDVFAVSGGVMSPAYAGANRLLRDGAIPVFSAYDVLCEYVHLYPDKLDMRGSDQPLSELPPNPAVPPKQQSSPEPPPKAGPEQKLAPATDLPAEATKEAKRLFEAFSESCMNMDELCEIAGLSTSQFLKAATELELYGLVTAAGGNRYQKASV